MNNIKNLLFARKLLGELTDQGRVMDFYEGGDVLCVDAEHFDEEGYISEAYTWYVPQGVAFVIERGDILVVEQIVGIGLAFVRATTSPYVKTKALHEAEGHPYCRVVSNLGDVNIITKECEQ